MIRWSKLFTLAISFTLIASFAFADEDEGREEDVRLTADDFPEEIRAQVTRADPQRKLPFRSGEVLHYRIGWGIFDVGSATLSIKTTELEGQPAWLMTLSSRTNAFADAFYRMRNETRSWLNPEFTRTLYYENQQNEGRRQRDVVVEFNWDESKALYTNRLDEDAQESWIPVLDGSFDPMAITYFVRSLPLAVGETYMVPTTTGREQFVTTVKVDRIERKRFRLGRMDAFVVSPDIKDVGGVFRRSSRANITFWFSADDARLPLRMESSVSVGSFWAELTRIEYTE
jgi:hypothetical protein